MKPIDSEQPQEAFYYDGYRQGHLDTSKMLARKSLALLFLGIFLGGGLAFLVTASGLLAEFGDDPAPEDPALTIEKPKEYVKAIEWAKRFTVGIVAETPGRAIGNTQIPGRSYIGSGIVLSKDGYVLTNSHVIPSRYRSLSVILGDSIFEARFVGHRPEYDIAVIKINADDLVAASLGNSDNVEQGDIAIAIGSPSGLFHTATEGIVSYKGRKNTNNETLIRNFIQTSAAINSGNSGGPLIDLTGRVIGINTFKLTNERQEALDGVGFAIPINLARKVANQIIDRDDSDRDATISSVPTSLQGAFLGVIIDRGYRPNLPSDGVMVREVILDTAADKAGIQAGDVIIAIEDTTVQGFDDLRKALSNFDPGDRIKIQYRRDQTERTVEVRLSR